MDKREEFLKSINDKLGIELDNEKFNFLGLLNIANHYKNERDCYLHYLIKLMDEFYNVADSDLPEGLLKVLLDINDVLNCDINIVSGNSLDGNKN